MVLSLDKDRCRFCGKSGGSLHVHHVRYRSEGGKHVEDNLIALHIECHDKVHGNKKLYQPLALQVIGLRKEETRYITIQHLEVNDV